MARDGGSRFWTLLLVGLAVPSAFALETAARALFLPPELEAIRRELSPSLTPLAWTAAALCAPAALLGVWAKRAILRRALAKLPDAAPPRRDRAEVEAVLLASSIPQIPALFATLASMAGAEALPVLIALGLSTAGVVALASPRL